MKIRTISILTAVATIIGWQLRAQTDSSLPSLCVVNGQVYDENKSQLWKPFDAEIVKILPGSIVVQTFTVETKKQAVVVRRLKANSYMTTDESKKYHDVTEMVDVGTEKVLGRNIIIRNYPAEEHPAVGKTISFTAMQTGTSDYNGDKLELWDLGTRPTDDDLKKLRCKRHAERHWLNSHGYYSSDSYDNCERF